MHALKLLVPRNGIAQNPRERLNTAKMDVGTHALASLTLTRALIPRAPLAVWMLIVVAGTLADVDSLSAVFGPTAF
jgi:hypothetical protein